MSRAFKTSSRINLNKEIVEFLLMECSPSTEGALVFDDGVVDDTKTQQYLVSKYKFVDFNELVFHKKTFYPFGYAMEFKRK